MGDNKEKGEGRRGRKSKCRRRRIGRMKHESETKSNNRGIWYTHKKKKKREKVVNKKQKQKKQRTIIKKNKIEKKVNKEPENI